MIIKGTSCYQRSQSGNLVSITGDGGNGWNFYGNAYKSLAPRLYVWQYYVTNPDNLNEQELIDWYIREFYESRLKNLDPKELLENIYQKFGNEIILLCHELPSKKLSKNHFCHRRLIADWVELETGFVIPEITIDKNGKIKTEEIYDLKPKIKKLTKK